jgi:hypothetical protein
VKTALLGCERAPAPVYAHPEAPLGGLLAQVKKEDREAALLTAVALIVSYEQSGMVAEAGGEPSLSHAPPDDLPRCGPGAAAYLRRILGGEFPFLLPEFLSALSAAGKRIPEELLPDLLENARSDRNIRTVASNVIGRRGTWLSALNPEWSFVGAQIAPTDWETGSRAGRVALLRHLRQSGPEQAIALLQSTWASDAPEDRAAFIPELEHGLSARDEPFLEAALDDRRKEVRQTALELLMLLPQSALVERMWQRVAPLIRLQKSSGLGLKKLLGKHSLEIDLPQACDDAMQRDGVAPKPPQGVGEKAWWLEQMARAIPPTRWEAHLQLSPEQCIAALKSSEFSSVLLAAAAEAARRYKDARWARPLLDIAMDQAKDAGPIPAAGKPWTGILEVVAIMKDADRDTVIMKRLDHHGETADVSLGLNLLHLSPGPWSPALAKSLLNLLRYIIRQAAEGKQPQVWAGYLTELACRMPVSVADEAEQGWPEDAATKNFFKPVQTIIEILQFRSKMLKDISR